MEECKDFPPPNVSTINASSNELLKFTLLCYLLIALESRSTVCFFVLCVCFLPVHSGHQVRWTYQPGSHRRKVTQDFSSTFFTLLCYLLIALESRSTVCFFVLCVCFLPVHSGHQVRWTYQPGSHRRKVTQDFSSAFFLRCVSNFFSRERFSHSFPSSTVKSNFVDVLHPLGIFFCFLFFSEKNPVCRDRTHVPTCQKVTRLPLSYRGDRQLVNTFYCF